MKILSKSDYAQQPSKLWVTGSNPVGVARKTAEIPFNYQVLTSATVTAFICSALERKGIEAGINGPRGTQSPAKNPATFALAEVA
jgi:hypothetical protein